MTKKEIIALADAMRDEGLTDRQLKALCTFMLAQNARFDETKWLGYIHGTYGPNGGK